MGYAVRKDGSGWRAVNGASDCASDEVFSVQQPEPPDQSKQIPDPITDRQFFQQLAVMGLITQQEALDAVGPGIIPASMDALIAQLPEDQRFPARMIVSGATLFHRYSPLVSLLGSLYGLSSAQIDKLWQDASKL